MWHGLRRIQRDWNAQFVPHLGKGLYLLHSSVARSPRIDDEKCKLATEFWAKNREYWLDVRTVWGQLLAQNKGLNIKTKTEDGKILWKEIDDLVEEFKSKNVKDSQNRQVAIRGLLNKYLIDKSLYSMK